MSQEQEVESKLDPLWVFRSLGMERMTEQSAEFILTQHSLLPRLGQLAEQTTIVSVHHNLASSTEMGKARLLCFERFRQAVAEKNAGDANCSLAWYGASRKEICQILSYGFTGFGSRGTACNGSAITLSPLDFPLDEVLCAEADEGGLSHVLLCRVILGKTEVVVDGSQQSHPSSFDFDCGVNNFERPTKYIVWNTIMNTHIYPSNVISFKAPYLGMSMAGLNMATRVSLNELRPVLSSHLHQTKLEVISRCIKELQGTKLSRIEMIKLLRQAVGDKLLMASIKFCLNKGMGVGLHNHNQLVRR